MGASNSTSQNIKFYSLKGKASESDTPNFSLTEKVNGAWSVTATFNTISGMLNAAEIKEKEYQGAKFNTFALTLDDGTEISKVELTHNAITHSFINALASNCNKLDTYNIQVYKKQSKGTDGKNYWNGGVSIKVGNSTEGQKWSIDPQSAPKKEPVMLADGKQLEQMGKKVWNHDKERAFWEEVFINKIQNVLKGTNSTGGGSTFLDNSNAGIRVNKTESFIQDTQVIEDDMDSLPF